MKKNTRIQHLIKYFFSKKFLIFALGGLISYGIKLGMTAILTEIVGMWYFHSYIISLAILLVFGFVYNSYFTYKSSLKSKENFFKYFLLLFIFIFIDAMLVKTLTDVLQINYLISIVVTTIIIFLLKFVVYDKFVFADRKMMISKRQIEIIAIFVLLIISIALRIPNMTDLVRGDAYVYSELSKSMIENGNYHFNGEIHNKYPPGYPFLSIPFMFLTSNEAMNLRIASLVWTSITIVLLYLISRRFKMPVKYSFITCLLVTINPWFLYFTSTIPGSESTAIMLYIVGIYLWLDKENTLKIYLASLSFGLSIITHYTFAFMVAPFGIYLLYHAFKKKEIVRNVASLAFMSAPLSLWIVRNLLIFSSPSPEGYNAHYAFWIHAPLMMLIFGVFVPIATFLVLLPLIIIQGHRAIKKKQTIWILILSGIILKLIVHIFMSYNPEPNLLLMAVSRLRYAVPFIPMLTILSVLSVPHFKKNLRKTVKLALVSAILIFLIITPYWNYGIVKTSVDKIIPAPDIFSQRTSSRNQAINWMNENLPENTTVIGGFIESGKSCGILEINRDLQSRLRPDIRFICTEYTNESQQICEKATDNSVILFEGRNICPNKDIRKTFSTGKDHAILILENLG